MVMAKDEQAQAQQDDERRLDGADIRAMAEADAYISDEAMARQ